MTESNDVDIDSPDNRTLVKIETQEWLKKHPDDPLVNAIRNWTGKRQTDCYFEEGYCEIVRCLYSRIFFSGTLSDVGSSSEQMSLYGLLSDIIVDGVTESHSGDTCPDCGGELKTTGKITFCKRCKKHTTGPEK